jgi:hypothetical protein
MNDDTGMVSALEIVAALDRAWQSIRARHREVPPVVLLLGPSPSRASARFRTHGCYLGAGWTLREAQLRSETAMEDYQRAVARLDPSEGLPQQLAASVQASRHAMAGLYGELAFSLPEVFMATEMIAAGANEMFKVLLHEAVHAIAHARGIKDTSRQGRYHNARFRALAQEAGLEPDPRNPVIGFSRTTLSATAAQEYRTALGELSSALAGQPGPQDRAAAAAARGPVCQCGSWVPMRRRRIEPIAGTVMCRMCANEP